MPMTHQHREIASALQRARQDAIDAPHGHLLRLNGPYAIQHATLMVAEALGLKGIDREEFIQGVVYSRLNPYLWLSKTK